jgi:hypothetical protein
MALTAAGVGASRVCLGVLPRLALRPPIAGHLRALCARGPARTAAYLGNLWRPGNGNGASLAAEAVRNSVWE